MVLEPEPELTPEVAGLAVGAGELFAGSGCGIGISLTGAYKHINKQTNKQTPTFQQTHPVTGQTHPPSRQSQTNQSAVSPAKQQSLRVDPTAAIARQPKIASDQPLPVSVKCVAIVSLRSPLSRFCHIYSYFNVYI